METTKRSYSFKESIKAGERCYPFHSGEEKDLLSSIKKVKEFMNGVSDFPDFRIGKGTYYASKVIIDGNNKDIRYCFEEYKNLHTANDNLPQGSSNPEDRFIRMLSVWTEAGAISVEKYKIKFEPVLIDRLNRLDNRSSYINMKILGIPYARNKVRGKTAGLKEWTEAVKFQTRDLPKIKEACILKVTFLLPGDKYPTDYPYGSDLDNLLKRFQDALNETIFPEAKGKDSCIISLHADKVRVNKNDEAGAMLEIISVSSAL